MGHGINGLRLSIDAGPQSTDFADPSEEPGEVVRGIEQLVISTW